MPICEHQIRIARNAADPSARHAPNGDVCGCSRRAAFAVAGGGHHARGTAPVNVAWYEAPDPWPPVLRSHCTETGSPSGSLVEAVNVKVVNESTPHVAGDTAIETLGCDSVPISVHERPRTRYNVEIAQSAQPEETKRIRAHVHVAKRCCCKRAPLRSSNVITGPFLVVSSNELNAHLRTVIVAPMTTGGQPYPWRPTCRLQNRAGSIVLDQLRTVDVDRLVKQLCRLDAATVRVILQSLHEMFAE